MLHVKKDKFGKTKLYNGVAISDMTGFFVSDKWSKIITNPGVLKMIQDCTVHKNKEEYQMRSEVGNINGSHNTSNMNTDTTHSDIV